MPGRKKDPKQRGFIDFEDRVPSEKMKKAVELYLMNGHNMTAAMIDAGYGEGYSRKQQKAFFGQPLVKKLLDQRLAELQAGNEVTAEQVDQAWKTLAFTPGVGSLLTVEEDGSCWVDMRKLTEDQRACIKAVVAEVYVDSMEKDEDGNAVPVRVKKTKVEFYDRQVALARWDKRLKLVSERLEVTDGDALVSRLMKGRQRAARG